MSGKHNPLHSFWGNHTIECIVSIRWNAYCSWLWCSLLLHKRTESIWWHVKNSSRSRSTVLSIGYRTRSVWKNSEYRSGTSTRQNISTGKLTNRTPIPVSSSHCLHVDMSLRQCPRRARHESPSSRSNLVMRRTRSVSQSGCRPAPVPLCASRVLWLRPICGNWSQPAKFKLDNNIRYRLYNKPVAHAYGLQRSERHSEQLHGDEHA